MASAPEVQASKGCQEPTLGSTARQNIEVIVERLRAQDFVHLNDDAQTVVTPFHPPGPAADGVLDWLTRNVDAEPMTLVSWLRHVGDVWLVGTHPDWPESSAADPLVSPMGLLARGLLGRRVIG